jgi:hypothetical protein
MSRMVTLPVIPGSRYARPGTTIASSLALQLSFLLGSESMCNHDSDIVDADGVG